MEIWADRTPKGVRAAPCGVESWWWWWREEGRTEDRKGLCSFTRTDNAVGFCAGDDTAGHLLSTDGVERLVVGREADSQPVALRSALFFGQLSPGRSESIESIEYSTCCP